MIFVKHTRAREQAMSVVLRASIITPEAREVADLLGFTITECDESIPGNGVRSRQRASR